MEDEIARTESGILMSLGAGDLVVAHDERGFESQGSVELTAPEIGVLWIRTNSGERKLLDVQEHAITALSFGRS
jgi:hypothetical protein